MKIVKGFILLSSLAVFFATCSYAEGPIDESSNAANLKLTSGMVTEVEFPVNIANVTKSVPSALLQIETQGNRMFLLARENFESLVYVVTQDNISYCLHLAVVEEKDVLSHVKIKKPSESSLGFPNGKAINTIKLLKALINGSPLPGAVEAKVKNGQIFNDGSIRIGIDKLYELPRGVKAVVLNVENLTYKPIVVPIEHIEFPGLLAISIENQIVEAASRIIGKKTTKAYMIIEGTNE